MKSDISFNWICLDQIAAEQFEAALKSAKCNFEKQRIFSLLPNEELKVWASKNRSYFQVIDFDHTISLVVPCSEIKLKLPVILQRDEEYKFLLKPAISSDNYLKGAILSLMQLIDGFTIRLENASTLAREFYLLFRNCTFFYFENTISKPFAIGNGLICDYTLIYKYGLKTSHIDEQLFKFINVEKKTDITQVSDIIKSNLMIKAIIFPRFFRISLKLQRILNLLKRFIYAFVILNNMIVFRLKRRFGK